MLKMKVIELLFYFGIQYSYLVIYLLHTIFVSLVSKSKLVDPSLCIQGDLEKKTRAYWMIFFKTVVYPSYLKNKLAF